MPKIESIVSECKALDQQLQNERQELAKLRALEKIETMDCDLLRKELEMVEQSNKSSQLSIKSIREQMEFLKQDQKSYNSQARQCAILENIMAAAEPNEEQQERQIVLLLQELEKIQNKYKQSKTYQQILETEASDRELSLLIIDKQNELMKLETQREF